MTASTRRLDPARARGAVPAGVEASDATGPAGGSSGPVASEPPGHAQFLARRERRRQQRAEATAGRRWGLVRRKSTKLRHIAGDTKREESSP